MANEDPYADRRRLTFEEAEGASPLPRQLELKEISQELRSKLWALVYLAIRDDVERDMGEELTGNWLIILRAHHIDRRHLPVDEFKTHPASSISYLKDVFIKGDYLQIFGFLQFVLRRPRCPPGFSNTLAAVLANCRAAYRIVNGNTIIPFGSDVEYKALKEAFADLGASEFLGARSHLAKAGEELTSGNFAASVRESIHAVESVSRVLEPSAKTLGPALGKLEKKAAIHGGLKSGFQSIYGYTSDEEGIRHSLLDDPQANVDEADALFMIGACASFASYLINKARSAGLLKPSK
jgi:hypothetical protein